MARFMGPRFKLARHLGVNVFGHPKALNRGVKQHKLSEYGEQLLEKQKLRAYYGVLEKQFKKIVFNALKSKEKSEDILVQSLERRLDNLVYRLGFGSTLREARQMVSHGHILVNGQKVDIPSYKVNIGDEVSLRSKSRKIQTYASNFTTIIPAVTYIEKDTESFSGRLIRLPKSVEVPVMVKYSKVLEFYSKN
ncbi:small subunit ribosomal protein S4 [Clostridium acetobutylicum]|uniref:Small ribosomal subunit protein uS4B n=1 Tax=Clostridium acetobutylicum (strain ATCC 824 / DSM 792 / JCM 1419 / IAM 19013 / LMG 5710 / NBRC 13948 / NRRL B-527 / VKM B-1787 / 2291 / W) TaxID=272562 RepID=RS4B_CLOAB|nr:MULTISPECIES: 30S ribosomal protein S4 [Clostridium]Q97J08.1 RecName: Full=Small ribosomal subunit protein uS4B; AltName: Full=30S ribosomal protein S4 2 [Clostridium acetobutylicum ATCC 824]AAK79446.1 Ribosomal protein S4 [Clostridium acetobutylicum ATCC 824]ADZ20531.1 30S ribosomal protein S4 [Clostridium acetobutylicum EA 2018]AEI33314.1 30S ribosomal protein S4 [Clostridium acetobutylicum DSM 1731]AWV81308.1 30S ribosomal protein S4 [Clostridium acetobutylicum]MBC2392942.1 30S ribosoma